MDRGPSSARHRAPYPLAGSDLESDGSLIAETRLVLGYDPVEKAAERWEGRGWPHAGSMAAAISLMRASQIVLARLYEILRPFGLTYARYELLGGLAFSRVGSQPIGRLSARLRVRPASMTNTIDRLEADGLIERLPDPTDRRTVLVQITAAGREVFDVASEALNQIAFGLGALSDEQTDELLWILRDLRLADGDFKLDPEPTPGTGQAMPEEPPMAAGTRPGPGIGSGFTAGDRRGTGDRRGAG